MTYNNTIVAEYIWLGGNNELRSKKRVIELDINQDTENKEDGGLHHIHVFPVWNYDGSSTGQAEGNNSEIFIHPRAVFKDPFNIKSNIITYKHYFDWFIAFVISLNVIVICTWYNEHSAAHGNFLFYANLVFVIIYIFEAFCKIMGLGLLVIIYSFTYY